MGPVQPPPREEFGVSRVSEKHVYAAELQLSHALHKRQTRTIPVLITDVRGRPIDNAVISVDGCMPEQGFGLPTQPRVTRSLGNGIYEIEDLRFSTDGWWELKLAINSPAGSDRVTFNLSI